MFTKEQMEAIGKTVSEVVSGKIDEIKALVKEETKADVDLRDKGVEVLEKSVMNMKRTKAPFVQLGKGMDQFCNELKAMIKGAPVLQSDQEKAAFNEGDNEDGGYTVPPELDTAILAYVEEQAIVRSRATIIKMKSNTWSKNKLDQSVNVFGGVTVTWGGESDTTTDTKFQLGARFQLVVKKMIMLTTESREILADSNIDFANYVVNIFGRACAHFEDVEFLNGDGTTQPMGIITDTAIPVVNRAVANQVSYADVNSMFYSLLPQFRSKAIWLGETSVIEYVDGLVNALTGRPIWSDSIQQGTPPTLKGKYFIETEKVSELGTKGDLIFADLSWYFIGDREGMTIDASIHDRFRYDEITVRLVKRVDGRMAMKNAAVMLDVPSVS